MREQKNASILHWNAMSKNVMALPILFLADKNELDLVPQHEFVNRINLWHSPISLKKISWSQLNGNRKNDKTIIFIANFLKLKEKKLALINNLVVHDLG